VSFTSDEDARPAHPVARRIPPRCESHQVTRKAATATANVKDTPANQNRSHVLGIGGGASLVYGGGSLLLTRGVNGSSRDRLQLSCYAKSTERYRPISLSIAGPMRTRPLASRVTVASLPRRARSAEVARRTTKRLPSDTTA
jgi:hypothetical protein